MTATIARPTFDAHAEAPGEDWGIRWRGSLLWRRHVMRAALLDQVRFARRVLDIGCAEGDVTADIAQTIGAESVTAIDVRADRIARAAKRFGGWPIRFLVGDILDDGPWMEPVDLVTASLVLEYLDDETTRQWLDRLRSGPLSQGGRLFVLRAVRPGNPLGVDQDAFIAQMQAGGFRMCGWRPIYGRLANLDRYPVGWLGPGPHRVRRTVGRALKPVVGSPTAARVAHMLGRRLIGDDAVDLVAATFAPS